MTEYNSELKYLAFKKVLQTENIKKPLEDVIDRSLSIDDADLNYDCEIGEILEREFSIDARENSGIKMLTVNIVQTYKQCKNDFDFEDTMKPRRELTLPNEGNYF
jgi:hypothetical protein